MTYRLSADYFAHPSGRLFYTHFAPESQSTTGHCVLVCLPFAEEMNRSRYMVNMLGQALAEQGIGLEIGRASCRER